MRKEFYQTEHPYKAQSISMFFENHPGNYLNPGRHDCGSVLQLLMRELDTKNRPNRLSVFLARPNRMKGTLAGHKTAANVNVFDTLQAGDEQLMYVK
ncbi:hypothetical protein GGP41_003865 [Bipolaris sorokiniana]|uniref:Uncharacterized protein n=1 Tax=Cochliobolus sativus TaxID=45130 RepID=A0A8H6DSJ5_COCSA|nr:hypothetical protein GGP41_003865 [Bipolaris sorokiniana]